MVSSLSTRSSLLVAALAAGTLAAAPVQAQEAAAAATVSTTQVAVRVDSPAPGTVMQGQLHQAEVVGSATADADQPARYDVFIVLDVSESTKAPCGVDLDGDGVIGLNPQFELGNTYPPEVVSTDPQDTVLHAEIQAARTLLRSLDPRRVRVGVISFAGEVDPITLQRRRIDQADAWLDVPLTDDYALVNRALTAILARGARGATNFAAAVRLVITELSGVGGARSVHAAGREARRALPHRRHADAAVRHRERDRARRRRGRGARRAGRAEGRHRDQHLRDGRGRAQVPGGGDEARAGHARHLHAGAAARRHRRDPAGRDVRERRGRRPHEPHDQRALDRRAPGARRQLLGLRPRDRRA